MIKYIRPKGQTLACVMFTGLNFQEVLDFDPETILLIPYINDLGNKADYLVLATNGQRIEAGFRVIHQNGATIAITNHEFHNLYENEPAPRGVKYPRSMNRSTELAPPSPTAVKTFEDDTITKQVNS